LTWLFKESPQSLSTATAQDNTLLEIGNPMAHGAVESDAVMLMRHAPNS
jgi:hypothetical protein